MRVMLKDKTWAFSSCDESDWNRIQWSIMMKTVRQFQMRIAKAVRAGKQGLLKKLQWLLSRSRAARLLAVKRVTTNKGRKTPGVDGVIWYTAIQKLQAVKLLKSGNCKPQPLLRHYIRKKNGKSRPLGIPTMFDRSMQAVHAMGLIPVAEVRADLNSYGFRPERSCADAIQQCFIALARKGTARWVLEGDIRGCFDNISHSWMYEHIPMNKRTLKAWLNSGYMENGTYHPTIAGTPQGGIISPVLANMTLDGLEEACLSALKKAKVSRRKAKVNVIRYADDFIVTGSSKELLENIIKPAIEAFMAERGLTLSAEKTRITHICDGIDFLGQNIRRHKPGLSITPSKASIESIVSKTREVIRQHRGAETGKLIRKLNPIITGWAQYHRHIRSTRHLNHVDNCIFRQLWKWTINKHPNKGTTWRREKYFRQEGTRNWTMFAETTSQSGKTRATVIRRTTNTRRFNHIKIRSAANPFLPEWEEYFTERRRRKYIYAKGERRQWNPSVV